MPERDDEVNPESQSHAPALDEIFSTLYNADTASALRVTPRTIQRDWLKAKAWLHRELNA